MHDKRLCASLRTCGGVTQGPHTPTVIYRGTCDVHELRRMRKDLRLSHPESRPVQVGKNLLDEARHRIVPGLIRMEGMMNVRQRNAVELNGDAVEPRLGSAQIMPGAGTRLEEVLVVVRNG